MNNFFTYSFHKGNSNCYIITIRSNLKLFITVRSNLKLFITVRSNLKLFITVRSNLKLFITVRSNLKLFITVRSNLKLLLFFRNKSDSLKHSRMLLSRFLNKPILSLNNNRERYRVSVSMESTESFHLMKFNLYILSESNSSKLINKKTHMQ